MELVNPVNIHLWCITYMVHQCWCIPKIYSLITRAHRKCFRKDPQHNIKDHTTNRFALAIYQSIGQIIKIVPTTRYPKLVLELSSFLKNLYSVIISVCNHNIFLQSKTKPMRGVELALCWSKLSKLAPGNQRVHNIQDLKTCVLTLYRISSLFEALNAEHTLQVFCRYNSIVLKITFIWNRTTSFTRDTLT